MVPNIFVIGSGGREHSMVQSLVESPQLQGKEMVVNVLPGNGGTQWMEQCGLPVKNHPAKKADDVDGIMDLAVDLRPILTLVGPEAPLVAGLADCLEEEQLPVFGPKKKAAIEKSKSLQKQLMDQANIPTAAYQVFSDPVKARNYVNSNNGPFVIKADGLCAGKGVVICNSDDQAISTIGNLMVRKIHGNAGTTVVIEELLQGGHGKELSVLAFCNGNGDFIMMPAAQDHKPAFNGNQGPNTGGMGAWSRVFWADSHLPAIEEKIFRPMINILSAKGAPFRGCLYAGLMITLQGPKVVEWNVRQGDPEWQANSEHLEPGVFFQLAQQCALGQPLTQPKFLKDFAVCLVLCAHGYPGDVRKGDEITGLQEAEQLDGVRVVHAGTCLKDGKFYTAGGRVINVVGKGPTLSKAVNNAYAGADLIKFEGKHMRTDIAKAGLDALGVE